MEFVNKIPPNARNPRPNVSLRRERLNLCVTCNEAFGSGSAFDAYRIGVHAYLYDDDATRAQRRGDDSSETAVSLRASHDRIPDGGCPSQDQSFVLRR